MTGHERQPPPSVAPRLTVRVLDGQYAVCRLAPTADIPLWAWAGPLASVTRTPAELSIVCPEDAVPTDAAHAERGWRALVVLGPLDFALVGILASLTTALASVGISLFALSTFDTDYLLVRASDQDRAVSALRDAGFQVEPSA